LVIIITSSGTAYPMFVLVSPAGPGRARVAVLDSQNLSALHVELRDVGDKAAGKALADAGLGEMDGDYAWLLVSALRNAGKGGTGSDWGRRFDAMLDHAGRNGWADEKRSRVRAHVVRT
jgi:hypothetical protein